MCQLSNRQLEPISEVMSSARSSYEPGPILLKYAILCAVCEFINKSVQSALSCIRLPTAIKEYQCIIGYSRNVVSVKFYDCFHLVCISIESILYSSVR